MTQDPYRWPPSKPDGSRDPLDDTQPVEVPRFAPAPDPRPDTRWAWAAGEPRPAGSSWSPGPQAAPSSSNTAFWRPAAPEEPLTGDRTAWPGPVAPVAAVGHRSGPGVGTVAAVALLSAVLASSGTVLALDASGAFRSTPSAPVAANVPGGTQTPVQSATGHTDDSAAVIASSAKVSPSVVKITTKAASSDPFSGSQGDGIGSGIIYDAGGWILTNHHVVTGADAMTVELKDGRSFSGTVYGIDTLTDLAIVKVDATGLPAASLGSSDGLKVGQLVVAVGSPLGTYSFSVTSGIVSGKGRQIITSDGTTITNLVQTDAAINPGNSGGPLADADGNVVGVNTAIADGSNGIGFAIPIDIAKPIMQQAVKGEKLQRPWIGVYFEAIDQKVKAAEKLSVDSGALVINLNSSGGSAILPNSPAAAAGLKDLDIVTAINGIAIDQEHPLNLLLVQFAPRVVVQLTVIRGGQTITVPLTLGVRPETTQ